MHTLAPAKVNLYLGVSARRDERGYHLVRTVMAPLALADEVEVELARAGGVRLDCEPVSPCPAPQNLAWRAAEALAAALGRPADVRIRLRKVTPSQAGLGGGSSDAAAVLRCLAELWGVGATDAPVLAAARSLGADVPFFLYGRTCLMEGLGDAHVASYDLPPLPLALVKPPAGVSTPAAYRAFDALGTPAADAQPLLRALVAGDAAAVPAACANNLQPAACQVEPLVAETLSWLGGLGAARTAPLLCGSGACCALFCATDAEAAEVAARARDERGWWACATRTA